MNTVKFWTKQKLIEYLRMDGWLDANPKARVPAEVEKLLPKILKKLNSVKS